MVSSCDCKDCELKHFVDGGIGALAVVLLCSSKFFLLVNGLF